MARSKKAKGHNQTQPSPGPTGDQTGLPQAHRFAFLQAVMERKWMPETEAKQTFAALDQLSGPDASYTETISNINTGLEFMLMELRRLRYPVDGNWYIAFVNKDNDEVAKKHGTSFSIPQVQYLKAVIESIAMDGDAEDGLGSISGVDAMNVNASEQGPTQATQQSQSSQAGLFYKAFGKGKMLALSMREKEEALEHFVRDGWLVKTPQARGFFSLGVRTFMELHQMLLDFNVPGHTRQAWEHFL